MQHALLAALVAAVATVPPPRMATAARALLGVAALLSAFVSITPIRAAPARGAASRIPVVVV
jgi:hypothetical protein